MLKVKVAPFYKQMVVANACDYADTAHPHIYRAKMRKDLFAPLLNASCDRVEEHR